jgi:hypothetical protein
VSRRAGPDLSPRPSRVERGARAQRTRRFVAAGAAAALLIGGLGVYLVVRDGSPDVAPAPTDVTGSREPPASALLALEVTGAPTPALAMIGVPADGEPFYMPLSTELSLIVPGQGEASTAGVAALPGDSMRVALSNLAGSWIDHFVVVSLKDLQAMVDGVGGLEVTLTDTYPTATDVLGPGEITMSGEQVRAFLAGATAESGARWEIVLGALFADPPELSDAPARSDDADAANAIWSAAGGAELLDLPTKRVGPTTVLPEFPALDELLSESLGRPVPVSTIVQNGSGVPGIGEAVAARIIPAGFRVVLAQNAQTFNVGRTDVYANGPEFEAEARAARAALGVGRVTVSAVPSNVGDIVIVIGKDFTA